MIEKKKKENTKKKIVSLTPKAENPKISRRKLKKSQRNMYA